MADYALMVDVRAAINDFLDVTDLSGPEMAFLYDKIEKIPAADVRENVRGRWLHKQDYEGEWICSLCTADLAFVYGLESGLPNFCPNCGADMRGEQNDES